jgi:putative ABC transport system permease protein
MALGASARDVRTLIMRQGMTPVAVGLGIGVAGALALGRLMESLLFAVTPTDPPTYLAAMLLLGAVAAVASYLPARRATGVDPLVVLRRE